jgi:hypothetical protein
VQKPVAIRDAIARDISRIQKQFTVYHPFQSSTQKSDARQ